VLTHILQSAFCFGVDLVFAFPAVALAKRESPASGVRTEEASPRKTNATVTTLPTCRPAVRTRAEEVAAVVDRAAEKPSRTRATA
jgi:hypothetical protein